jgi:hypothetical protein
MGFNVSAVARTAKCAGFESLLRDWMAAQPSEAQEPESLGRKDKTFRSCIAQNCTGPVRLIAQVSIYSQ